MLELEVDRDVSVKEEAEEKSVGLSLRTGNQCHVSIHEMSTITNAESYTESQVVTE